MQWRGRQEGADGEHKVCTKGGGLLLTWIARYWMFIFEIWLAHELAISAKKNLLLVTDRISFNWLAELHFYQRKIENIEK